MSESIKVEGLDKLVRHLKKLNPDLVAELKKTNKDMADKLAPVARSLAPRDTGTLAASVRAGATAKSGVVRAGKKSVPYAGAIHFGWPRHHISPNPFLWNALDSRRSEIEAEYLERVEKLVEGVNADG